jgi:hypothetical protein
VLRKHREVFEEMSIKHWIMFLILAPLAGLIQGFRRD